MLASSFLAAALVLPSLVAAQLSGSVGPLTTFKTKAAKKVCNVLDYGAKADSSTDIGPAITSAWAACKTGGLVYIPPGTYAMKTWVDLSGGSAAAIQLDGTIIRTGTDGGNMIGIKNSNDIEFFSGNSKGAIQGYGYQYISKGTFGARFMRFTNVKNFSLHGIALIDSASYYVVFDSCTNGEIYNLILRGISIGETDGIDIWGTNIWVHDVEVTNGDECVTVKSPAHNILIESIYCNLSGGTAIGSLGVGTDISNVYYRRLYMNQADPCYLKTNGGDGTVSGITWDTVIVHKGPYVLAVNEAWGTDRGSTGVQVSNLTYKNWYGYNTDNSRPTIRLECDPDVPCHDITLTNVNLWTASGSNVKWSCQNAYGSGACLRAPGSKLTTYTSATTISSKPNYDASSMPNDHASAYPSTASFTIPALPTTFYPGAKPSSALLNLNGAGGLRRRTAAPAPTEAAVLG